MPFNKDNHTDFSTDIVEEGFHIFSRENAKLKGFYPNQFPDYPEFDISKIKIDDRVTIRAFFFKTKSSSSPIDSGHIDLEVEFIDYETQVITANILTELPAHFALSAGTSIELSVDEILQLNNR
jgi:hypothetical protein